MKIPVLIEASMNEESICPGIIVTSQWWTLCNGLGKCNNPSRMRGVREVRVGGALLGSACLGFKIHLTTKYVYTCIHQGRWLYKSPPHASVEFNKKSHTNHAYLLYFATKVKLGVCMT